MKLEYSDVKNTAAKLQFRTKAFIDGKFVNTASGKTYASVNPANSQPLANNQTMNYNPAFCFDDETNTLQPCPCRVDGSIRHWGGAMGCL